MIVSILGPRYHGTGAPRAAVCPGARAWDRLVSILFVRALFSFGSSFCPRSVLVPSSFRPCVLHADRVQEAGAARPSARRIRWYRPVRVAAPDERPDGGGPPRGGARQAARARGDRDRRVAHRRRGPCARPGRELSHRARDPAARHPARAQRDAAARDRDRRRERRRGPLSPPVLRDRKALPVPPAHAAGSIAAVAPPRLAPP